MQEQERHTSAPDAPGSEHARPSAAAVRARLRALHVPGDPLLLPNAWDCGSAAALYRAGFAAVGTTSLGVAATAGLPDGAAATRDQTADLARRVASLPVPVTVDIEGGFSTDPEEVAAFARELADAGVAGVNLEDGLPDSTLVEPARHAAKVAAVRAAAPHLFVNARTDTHWLNADPTVPAAVRRGEAYATAGADGVFVPGLTDGADIAAVVRESPLPVNVLLTPGGHSCGQLAELGVARISLGSLLYRAALGHAVRTAAAALAPEGDGTTPVASRWAPDYAAVQELADEFP